jgi:BMFP domain-containing protein YqiC
VSKLPPLPAHDYRFEDPEDEPDILAFGVKTMTAYTEQSVKQVAEPLLARIAELEAKNVKLEQLCDSTYVAQGADAYNRARDLMEQWQGDRAGAGKEIGCQGSLSDGMGWLYTRIAELEAQQAQQPLSEREANIGRAIERAARELPDGAVITIDLEKDAGTVTCYVPEPEAIFVVDGDGPFSEQINEAICACIKAERAAIAKATPHNIKEKS